MLAVFIAITEVISLIIALQYANVGETWLEICSCGPKYMRKVLWRPGYLGFAMCRSLSPVKRKEAVPHRYKNIWLRSGICSRCSRQRRKCIPADFLPRSPTWRRTMVVRLSTSRRKYRPQTCFTLHTGTCTGCLFVSPSCAWGPSRKIANGSLSSGATNCRSRHNIDRYPIA